MLLHAILPALSLVLVGLGGWFMGMRSLVSNIVTEDYVTYAELGGVARPRILRSYVMRNALMPQVTGLAISLGGIFNGAIITEQVFGYPGIGTLLVDAVHAGDYSLVLGVATVSIIAVAVSVLLIDLAYPLLDPRVKAALMGRVLRDLLRYQPRIRRSASPCWRWSSTMAALSAFSPYPPNDILRRAARHTAVLGLSSRHHVARPGRVLAADLRDPQLAAVRRAGGIAQPLPVSADRTDRGLCRRHDRPRADVDQ